MARVHYWQYIVDDQGRPLQDVNIRFYLSDNPTQEADIFTHHALGAPTTTSTALLKTNGDGFFELWVGDEFENVGGYVSTQKFKLVWQRAGIQIGSISNIDMFPAVFKVDETDNISSTVTDKNKTISNELAYKWDTHVDTGFAGTPHDFEPVDTLLDDSISNKLVSNNLMNWILSAVASAGSLSRPASAVAVQTAFTIPHGSWSVSGDGSFYYDISHFTGTQYPVVQVVKRKTHIVGSTGTADMDNFRFDPLNVRSLSKNVVRLSVSTAIDAEVTVIG